MGGFNISSEKSLMLSLHEKNYNIRAASIAFFAANTIFFHCAAIYSYTTNPYSPKSKYIII